MKLSLPFFGCLLATLFCVHNAEAGFSNSGRMQGKHLSLSIGGTLDNNGELIGLETATLSCDTLSGKGKISSPQIAITTNIFAFTGTIECADKCVIIAKTPFDDRMFKRVGKGEFVVIIDQGASNPITKSLTGDYMITDELLMHVE